MGVTTRMPAKDTSERLDLRISKKHKAVLVRVAMESRRTVTSLIEEWCDILAKDLEPKT